MTSNQVYVWVWLPDATKPVVAGVLKEHIGLYYFAYGKSYLEHKDAIALYDPELPLKRGEQRPNYTLAGCLRDGAPDAWGRRVILQRLLGRNSRDADPAVLDELTYMLESGSDRIGALDFQASPTEYVPREKQQAPLDAFQNIADLVTRGEELPAPLAEVIQHGTSIGGARPKVLVDDGERKCIAKFSTSTDHYNVVKSEYVAMRLAALAGLNVAPVALASVAGRDVLLVDRFDRCWSPAGWSRRSVVSALTILGLDEMRARHASYAELAEIIRQRFTKPKQTLRELYRRLVFNILLSNTDDHARNHAAFWDGRQLSLTPAYDICPQLRAGREASQGMLISGGDNLSRINTCFKAGPAFALTAPAALEIVEELIVSVQKHWAAIADEAALNSGERQMFRQRQLFNPGIFDGLDDRALEKRLRQLAK